MAVQDKVSIWLSYQHEFGENLALTADEGALKQVIAKTKATNSLCQKATTSVQDNRVQQSDTKSVQVAHVQIQREGSHSVNEDLEALKRELCAYDGCALKAMAQTTVFADGDPTSNIMFIGEAPGAEEDKQGLPFVGQSGQLLNKMIEAIGLTRDSVYITNVVNWRPPGNRPPTPEEVEQCWPFLKRHIDVISPQFIVLLGSTAMKGVLKLTHSLSQARGFFHRYPLPNGEAKVLVTFHPSYLLRVPSQKRLAWEDFLMIKGALNTIYRAPD
ncbi:MAG: uracil-DNA glycosylase [Holosporales bacterium]|jgi:DNA polymerase|nr:uracil-DNA glycosylase [Holosporales bacterium]